MTSLLAEIPYPRIDPVILHISDGIKVRWYGISYVLAFVLAYFVLRSVAPSWPSNPTACPTYWAV